MTDTGLKHLTGLIQLQSLNLERTKATEIGVKVLQKALPNCMIFHALLVPAAPSPPAAIDIGDLADPANEPRYKTPGEGVPYNHDPSTWHEEVRPPRTDRASRAIWRYAANYSEIEWRVSVVGGQVRAKRGKQAEQQPGARPEFDPKAGGFHGPSAFARVDDGWLIAFNHGEFGAALYWFSRNGNQSYKISDHQVVDFISTPDGILATEGLAHMSSSQGSLIRIAREKGDKQWTAKSLVKLPFAPYAVSLRRNGILLITLSDALVAVTLGDKVKVETLLADADWGSFHPISSALTPDERKLYIGMRQFVGEFDLQTKKLRFLLPDKQFLNRFPKGEEDSLRKQYGG